LLCDVDATSWLSGENATASTQFEWPLSTTRLFPVATSQSLTVLSCDADATRRPSEENATASTQSEWPTRTPRFSPVATSQSLAVLSYDADAINWLSGENATAMARFGRPSSGLCATPVSTSQSLTDDWCLKFPSLGLCAARLDLPLDLCPNVFRQRLTDTVDNSLL
jgi:hypothetical protein